MATEPGAKSRRIFHRPERETFVDHFVAGIVSAVVMMGMVAIVPLILVLESADTDVLDLYWVAHIWGPLLMGAAFLTGLACGPRKMAELWGHLWGTEEPANDRIARNLWLAILAIMMVTWMMTWDWP